MSLGLPPFVFFSCCDLWVTCASERMSSNPVPAYEYGLLKILGLAVLTYCVAYLVSSHFINIY